MQTSIFENKEQNVSHSIPLRCHKKDCVLLSRHKMAPFVQPQTSWGRGSRAFSLSLLCLRLALRG